MLLFLFCGGHSFSDFEWSNVIKAMDEHLYVAFRGISLCFPRPAPAGLCEAAAWSGVILTSVESMSLQRGSAASSQDLEDITPAKRSKVSPISCGQRQPTLSICFSFLSSASPPATTSKTYPCGRLSVLTDGMRVGWGVDGTLSWRKGEGACRTLASPLARQEVKDMAITLLGGIAGGSQRRILRHGTGDLAPRRYLRQAGNSSNIPAGCSRLLRCYHWFRTLSRALTKLAALLGMFRARQQRSSSARGPSSLRHRRHAKVPPSPLPHVSSHIVSAHSRAQVWFGHMDMALEESSIGNFSRAFFFPVLVRVLLRGPSF